MEIILNEGERLLVSPKDGIIGAYIVLECKNGEINTIDAKRGIKWQN